MNIHVFTCRYLISLENQFLNSYFFSPTMTACIESTENVIFRNSAVRKKEKTNTEVYQTPSMSRIITAVSSN